MIQVKDGFRSKKASFFLLVLAAFFALLLVLSRSDPSTASPASTSLRAPADKLGILVGAAAEPAHFSEPEYAVTLAREFNMIEPENAMKWTHTERVQGQFTFADGDEVVSFAEAHHMKVRGHNLLWYAHNPAWLEQGQWTARDLREIMRNHILRVARHYAGKVFAWDVVNEAFNSEGQVRHCIWYDQPGIELAGQGTAYIEQAFRWAHQADPKALLFYNDYAAEGINPKSDAIYAMVKDFKARGVPIDGVGLQMHLSLVGHTASELMDSLASLESNIDRLGRLGVQVQITEMDLGLPLGPDGHIIDVAALQHQAEIYGRVAGACARNLTCTAFQTWGFTDRYSWIPGFTHRTQGAALLFDADYRPKPAYEAILKAFDDARRSRPGAH